jgi:glycosyltransferase involved in cell wall biosynthesis
LSITILLPTYNGARHLAQTVRSLLSQEAADFRLVCVDDASTDGSPDLVASFGDPRITVLENPVRLGITRNWNRALAEVTGSSFLIAHQDDLYEPAFLGTLAAALDARQDAFIAHCHATAIDEDGRPFRSPAEEYKKAFWPAGASYERRGEAELRALLRGNYINCPSVLYRTSAASVIGRFGERWEFVPDWEYWFRGVLAGFTVTGVNAPLLRYRRHASATRGHETSLRRYREEIELLAWAAEALRAQGVETRADARDSPVRKTLVADFSARLQRGDGAGARSLIDFARKNLPGFERSRLDVMLTAALALGAPGGWLLRAAIASVLRWKRPR